MSHAAVSANRHHRNIIKRHDAIDFELFVKNVSTSCVAYSTLRSDVNN